MDEKESMREVGLRIQGLREACDYSLEEMAAELDVDPATLREWEETGADVPISAIYHMARMFNVELTEILTGTAAKLDTYHVVRRGQGKEVDRYPDITTTTWRGVIRTRSCSLSSWCSIRATSLRNWSPIAGRSSTSSSKAPSSSCSTTRRSSSTSGTAFTSTPCTRTVSVATAISR